MSDNKLLFIKEIKCNNKTYSNSFKIQVNKIAQKDDKSLIENIALILSISSS